MAENEKIVEVCTVKRFYHEKNLSQHCVFSQIVVLNQHPFTTIALQLQLSLTNWVLNTSIVISFDDDDDDDDRCEKSKRDGVRLLENTCYVQFSVIISV